MVNLPRFRTIYPEFKAQADALVQECLDFAALRTDSSVFGDLTDEAHAALAADILASRPSGREAKMKDMTKTCYAEKRAELEMLVGGFQGGAI
jgi:hypothetical protein